MTRTAAPGVFVRVVDGGDGQTAWVESYEPWSGRTVQQRRFGAHGRGPIEPSVTVLIRTLNEARLLGATLRAIAEQIGGAGDGGRVEVLVVDSGSTDGTLEIATVWGARLVTLPPSAFSYGGALNAGIALASGDIVVHLSAHAVPLGGLWLANLVAPFAADPLLAGVFGAELDWPDATPVDRLRSLFKLTSTPRATYVWPPYMAFSNANGAVRRALARGVPFDATVPAAEDRLWAEAVAARGYRVLYQPYAPVAHSHYLDLAGLWRLITRAWSVRVAPARSDGARAAL